MSRRTALVMAGGTGGHIFPALAVAEVLRERGWHVVWLGNAEAMESRLVPPRGFEFVSLGFGALRGKGMGRKLKLPFSLAVAIARALRLLGEVRPGVVLGMGGYVSFPGAVAARLRGIPLVVHEQNAVAGLANRCWRAWPMPCSLASRDAAWRALGGPTRCGANSLPCRARGALCRTARAFAPAGGGWQPWGQGAQRGGAGGAGAACARRATRGDAPVGQRPFRRARASVCAPRRGRAVAAFHRGHGRRPGRGRFGRLARRGDDGGRARRRRGGGAAGAFPPCGRRSPNGERALSRRWRRGAVAASIRAHARGPGGIAAGFDRERCRQMALAARALARPEATEALADELERLAKDGT